MSEGRNRGTRKEANAAAMAGIVAATFGAIGGLDRRPIPSDGTRRGRYHRADTAPEVVAKIKAKAEAKRLRRAKRNGGGA